MPASGIAIVSPELRSRFLQGIPPEDLKVILASAMPRRYLRNSIVVNQDTPADHLFLLTKGRARYFYTTEEGRKNLLFWLTPGDVFGGAAFLFTPSSYLVSTETVKDSSVLVWNRVTIRSLGARYPRLVENALLTASDYLVWYVAAHVALTSHTARQRLARVLICLAETIGQKVQGGFEFDATNEELASAANITPFTASRLLRGWQKDCAVVKRRGKILLRSPERLLLHTA